jgi:transposase
MDLTDEQWDLLEPLIPQPPRRKDGRGRPWRDPRDVLNGILWILRTGAPWKDLPERYPPYQTCHRRFQVTDEGNRHEEGPEHYYGGDIVGIARGNERLLDETQRDEAARKGLDPAAP